MIAAIQMSTNEAVVVVLEYAVNKAQRVTHTNQARHNSVTSAIRQFNGTNTETSAAVPSLMQEAMSNQFRLGEEMNHHSER